MSDKIYFYDSSFKDSLQTLPNRSLFFGEGVFETFRHKDSLPAYYNRHIKRLKKGCDYLKIPFPKEHILSSFITESIKKSQLSDAYVKISVFSKGGDLYHEDSQQYLLCSVIRPYPGEKNSMKLCIARDIKISQSSLTLHKSTNYMHNIISKREAVDSGYDEALFLNEKGNVTECTAHNIFWITNDKLYTPSIKNGLLPGVTRGIILDICRDLDIDIEQGDFITEDTRNSDCIFLTNAISAMVKVNNFGGYHLSKKVELYDKIQYNLLTRLKWN